MCEAGGEVKELFYDVTVLVSGKSGTVTVKLGKIPRDSIFAPDYPEAIRAVVKLYESSFEDAATPKAHS